MQFVSSLRESTHHLEGEHLTKSNLRRRLSILLAKLDQSLVVNHLPNLLSFSIEFVLVAQGRVLRDVNAMGLVEFDKRRLLQPAVEFHLMNRRYDINVLQQTLHLRSGEV